MQQIKLGVNLKTKQRECPCGFISLKEIEKFPLLKGSAFLIILSVQGIYDTPLYNGYKLIFCALRCEMILPGFGIHVQK